MVLTKTDTTITASTDLSKICFPVGVMLYAAINCPLNTHFSATMLPGTKFASFVLGPKIGQGAFGEIYAVRSASNKVLAIKIEQVSNERPSLEFEAAVMKRLQTSPYFPQFDSFGRIKNLQWLSMELLGPSLSTVLKRLPERKLSYSTAIRTISYTLKGIEDMHNRGYIHRDIKPSNILLRRSRDFPIAIIDFGLARIYIDRQIHQHLPPRRHPGFRGTAVYASIHAHLYEDLSRRDDLISWFYLLIDLINGTLPWKNFETRPQILHCKRQTKMSTVIPADLPQLIEIWDHISGLGFEDVPDYGFIHQQLDAVCRDHNIRIDDEFDWHPQILQMDGTDEMAFESQRRIESSDVSTERTFSASKVKTKRVNDEALLPTHQEDPDCCCNIL